MTERWNHCHLYFQCLRSHPHEWKSTSGLSFAGSGSKALPSTGRALRRNIIIIHFTSSVLEEVHLQMIHQKLLQQNFTKKHPVQSEACERHCFYPHFNSFLCSPNHNFHNFLESLFFQYNPFCFLCVLPENLTVISRKFLIFVSWEINYPCSVGILFARRAVLGRKVVPNIHQK